MKVNVADVGSQIEEAMLRDRHRLRQSLRRIRDLKTQGKPFDRSLARLQETLDKSLSIRTLRTERELKIDFPEELPISSRRDEIAEAIRDNQVVIICGETGSGKSTQLPKICLDLGRGSSATSDTRSPVVWPPAPLRRVWRRNWAVVSAMRSDSRSALPMSPRRRRGSS